MSKSDRNVFLAATNRCMPRAPGNDMSGYGIRMPLRPEALKTPEWCLSPSRDITLLR